MIDARTTSNLTLTLADMYAPIGGDLEDATRIFDRELAGDLSFVSRLCDTVRSYRGKMLRPALLLLSARAAGQLSQIHHTLAAVVEMVHMATLVHDDVLDEADERRRQPTISSTEGNVAAVLLGDYLISHAFHLCSSLPTRHASRRIGATTNVVCEGELLQNHHGGDPGLTEADYLDIIRRKTGALTAVSCELGAHFAGADSAITGAIGAYGMSAGVAFQIIDDVLDIIGNRNEVGKTLGQDLKRGKLTLPTIHCLAHASPATRRELIAALVGEAPCDRARLGQWLAETASIRYAISAATEHVTEALRELEPLAPSHAKNSLVTMAEFIVRRTS